MAAVVDGLLARFPDAAFNLVGSVTDDAVPHPRVTDLRGAESVRGTVGLLRGCDLAIASDSGLAHAAAAVGVPTLVVFGPTQIAKNLPRGAEAVSLKLACRPCQYRAPRIGLDPATFAPCAHACMRELDAERVVGAAILMLDTRPKTRYIS
jgi:ADP-heptose:LPS heptosyltransferase